MSHPRNREHTEVHVSADKYDAVRDSRTVSIRNGDASKEPKERSWFVASNERLIWFRNMAAAVGIVAMGLGGLWAILTRPLTDRIDRLDQTVQDEVSRIEARMDHHFSIGTADRWTASMVVYGEGVRKDRNPDYKPLTLQDVRDIQQALYPRPSGGSVVGGGQP